MTSNGILLAPLADELYKNGLNRVNISLPTLNAKTFKKLNGGKLEYVLKSVEAAVKAKFDPVKLNMTILKGINDQDVDKMIDFAGKTGTILQIIELEPLSMSDEYYLKHHKALDEYELLLKRKALKVNYRKQMQNRAVYTLPDATVEVVHPIENTDFCNHCTRLRITSDGKLKPCLMREDNLIDILTPLRSGLNDKKLIELFKLANKKREPYYKGKRE
jgi:cyclic pyranopterin phosphate synthase